MSFESPSSSALELQPAAPVLKRRVDAIIVRELDSEVLLLDTEMNRIHQLNLTAGFIWRACDGMASPHEIAERLTQEFDVGGQLALEDVVGTLAQLRSLNLVVEG
jgi:hypothetical protein